MTTRADIQVLAPDRPDVSLVVEVRRRVDDLAQTEEELKRYMQQRGCPVALLVTPETTTMYRDTYGDQPQTAIEEVGRFSTAALLDVPEAPEDERDLERMVSDWLERLSSSWWSALPVEAKARQAVSEYLAPAVSEGRVMSGMHG